MKLTIKRPSFNGAIIPPSKDEVAINTKEKNSCKTKDGAIKHHFFNSIIKNSQDVSAN
jgi:hypothetical protein